MEFWDVVVSEPLIWDWYLDEICDLIQRTDERVFARLPKEGDVIINQPPGTSKTMIGCVEAVAWDFCRMPQIRVGIGSFSDDVVMEISDKIRLIMDSPKYKLYFPYVNLRKDLNNKHNFKTLQNGSFKAFTTSSRITGTHYDKIVIDDPIDPKGMSSAAQIYSVNTKFFDKTIVSRKTNPENTVTYLIMQRLAVNDPTGHLLARNMGHIHLCLPATATEHVKPASLKAKYVNGYLNPKRFNQKVLDDFKKSLGTREFEGQYGQNPIPSGGNTIKTDWIKQVDYDDIPKEVWNQPTDMIIDTAMTNDKTNDPSGILCCVYHDNILYLLNFWTDWLKQNDLVKKIAELGDDWCDKKSRIMIEKKANGHATIDELARIYHNKYNVIGLDKSVGKQAMLDAYAASIESGKVVMLRGSWNADFRDQVCGFPAMAHDEAVDCLTHACKHYFTIVSSGRYTAMA